MIYELTISISISLIILEIFKRILNKINQKIKYHRLRFFWLGFTYDYDITWYNDKSGGAKVKIIKLFGSPWKNSK